MDSVDRWLSALSGFVWGPYMLILLVGTGLVFMVVLRFMPFRRLGTAVRLVVRGGVKQGEGDISSLQALATGLSATVGTGNIAGVATAITLGGPGAIFWMWVCALVGMATKYSEVLLAVKYRQHLPDGTVAGGPMYYISRGLGLPWLAAVFAFCGIMASLGIGNMVQANSVAIVLRDSFSIPCLVTGPSGHDHGRTESGQTHRVCGRPCFR